MALLEPCEPHPGCLAGSWRPEACRGRRRHTRGWRCGLFWGARDLGAPPEQATPRPMAPTRVQAWVLQVCAPRTLLLATKHPLPFPLGLGPTPPPRGSGLLAKSLQGLTRRRSGGGRRRGQRHGGGRQEDRTAPGPLGHDRGARVCVSAYMPTRPRV